MMDAVLFALIGLALGLGLAFSLLHLKGRKKDEAPAPEITRLDAQLGELRHSLDSLSGALRTSLHQTQENVGRGLGEVGATLDRRFEADARLTQENTRITGERLERNETTLRALLQKLAALEEGHRRVFELGQGLRELQDILRAPKLRGGLGESLLETLLTDILPAERLSFQHSFRSREKVDAAITLPQGLLPIDAKFPLENFRRLQSAAGPAEADKARREFHKDLRKHIDDVAGKYILPAEGTLELAFLYIPAESVYYEAVLSAESEGMLSYALGKRVVPVSPASLYAYLQVILLGLNGFAVEQRALDILRQLRALAMEFAKVQETVGVLGGHLDKAQKSHSKLTSQLAGFERSLSTQAQSAESDASPHDL